MRIGIDFDNTIALYDDLFREVALAEGLICRNWSGKSKTDMRNHLQRQAGGEKKWMRLQGMVYGKYMHRAALMPGVASFLFRCAIQGHEVFIVSHKTEYGHFDPDKVPLRDEAMRWMAKNGFFDDYYLNIEKRNVFFAGTRRKKVEIIAELDCDYFIDDLEKVFLEDHFPESTQKILFDRHGHHTASDSMAPLGDWDAVSNSVLGQITDPDALALSNLLTVGQSTKTERISGRGNSQIHKVTASDSSEYALKIYPDLLVDKRPRLNNEVNALKLMNENGLNSVPEVAGIDEHLNIGLYQWIDGKPVDSSTSGALKRAVAFIRQLHGVSKDIVQRDRIGPASEACLSGTELVHQVDGRFKRLEPVKKRYPELGLFLDETFSPVWQEIKASYFDRWPGSSRERELPAERQVLSPSDFGFHNALETEDGRIIFIDFEYFGWDDPVKLTADFILHPGMNHGRETIASWTGAMNTLFSVNDADFNARLDAALPMYCMRWVMILLNEFLPGVAEKRGRAAASKGAYDREASQRIQLEKAVNYIRLFENIIHGTHRIT